ncbi:Uncharacterised protein [Mycobacteroides abscessus subsp. abscessus]|nr:Uncharacterised protein [Mycobacteroides abscessus subsp. abscessus]
MSSGGLLLGFYDGSYRMLVAQRVVRWASCCRPFFDSLLRWNRFRHGRVKWRDRPTGGLKPGVNAHLSSSLFKLHIRLAPVPHGTSPPLRNRPAVPE